MLGMSGLLLVSCGFCRPAFGAIYSGTITETITFTNDATFSIGQVFMGSYEYESETMDGLFGMPDRNHDQAINTLKGAIINWNPRYIDGTTESYLGGPTCRLTVLGNTVTDFNFDGEYSFGQFWFTESTFEWAGYFPLRTGIRTSGTISFSDPVAVPEGLISTGGLLAAGILGLALFRRRFRKNAL